MSDTNLTVEDKRLNFTKISDLNLIKSTVKENAAKLNGIDEATINLLVNDTTDAIKNVNDKIASVTDLTSETTKNIFSTSQVLQDQVKMRLLLQKPVK